MDKETTELRGEVEMLRTLVQALWAQVMPNTPEVSRAVTLALTNAAEGSEDAKAAIAKHKPHTWRRKNMG